MNSKHTFNLQVLKDVLLIAGFYGMFATLFSLVERWTFFQSVYFISSTVSTVGYGDISPDTSYGQTLCCLMIVVGVSLVFTEIRKYIDSLHEIMHAFYERLLGLVGLHSVDIETLPIYKFSPAEVEAKVSYRRKYALALAPLFMLLTIAFVIGRASMGLTVVQSLYFTVVSGLVFTAEPYMQCTL